MRMSHDSVHYVSSCAQRKLQLDASRKEMEKEMRKAPDEWGWEPHLRPLYSLFAERVLRELGEYQGLLFAGLPEPKPIEDPSLPPEVELSSAYSMMNDAEDVKWFGTFYTPSPIVSYVLRRLGYPGKQDGPILDPACGTGAFLVEATRRYLSVNPQAGWRDLTHEMRGVDIDPVAVLISRARGRREHRTYRGELR
jgi:hypothetical protein